MQLLEDQASSPNALLLPIIVFIMGQESQHPTLAHLEYTFPSQANQQ